MPPPALDAFPLPSLGLLATEPLRAMLDFCAAHLRQPPPVEGDGHPVVVYPGLGAGAFNTSQLRDYLKACNFTVHDWELGVNTGPHGHFDEWLGPLVERVLALNGRHARRVSLIGWSLGGLYAREVAKRCPHAVRQVVTLATPFAAIGDGHQTGTLLKLLDGSATHTPAQLQARLRERPPVPMTSIFSKSDGVVSWRGCVEVPGPGVENVQVQASHLGMASHPEVLRVIADRLAQPEDDWRPFRRRAARQLDERHRLRV